MYFNRNFGLKLSLSESVSPYFEVCC